MSCLASPQNSELNPLKTPNELLLNLNLPEETEHIIDDRLNFCYSADNFRLILKIFATQNALWSSHKLLKEDLALAELNTEFAVLAMDRCNSILHEVNDNVKIIYELSEIEIKKYTKKARKEKLKTIFISLGSGIIGVSAGIIIGFFAIQ